ncbi:hypothetical protein Tco_1409008 [Tanacetum coccineum]
MKLSWNDWLMYPLSIARNGNGYSCFWFFPEAGVQVRWVGVPVRQGFLFGIFRRFGMVSVFIFSLDLLGFHQIPVLEGVNNEDIEYEDVEIEIDDDAELIFPYEVKFDKTPPPGNVSSDFVSSDSVSSDSESETESRRSSRELEVKWFSCRAKIALLKSNNKVEGIREWGECHIEKKLVERCSHGDGSLLTAVSKPAGSDDVDYRASRQESRNLLLIGTDGSSEHMERPRTLCRLVSLLVSFEITELNDRHQLVEQPPDLGIALIIASHVLDSLDFGKGYGYSSMRSTAKWSSNKSNSCREGKEGSGVKKGRGRKERGEEEGRKMEEGGEGGRRGNRRREVGGRGEGDGRSGGEGEGRGKGVRGRREGKEG